jgi:hypothetical protein
MGSNQRGIGSAVSLARNNRNKINDRNGCVGAKCHMSKVSHSLVLQIVREGK